MQGLGRAFDWERTKKEYIAPSTARRNTSHDKNNIHRDVDTDTEIVHGWRQCAGRLAVDNCAEYLIKISSFHVSIYGISSIVAAAR